MNFKNKGSYSAFTLVEIIIVVAIIGILMAISVPIARFAIQQANDVQHRSAAEQLSSALIAAYAENRKYPTATDLADFGAAMESGGILDKYLGEEFDGGSDATFYYVVPNSTNPQWYVVCVTYGGVDDASEQGGFCTGNGFGAEQSGIPSKELDSTEVDTFLSTGNGLLNSSQRTSTDWVDGVFE